jgi:hypothetical protein
VRHTGTKSRFPKMREEIAERGRNVSRLQKSKILRARLSPRRLHPAAIISRAEPSSWRLIGPVPVMIELNPRSFHDPNLITPFGPLPAERAELIRYLV